MQPEQADENNEPKPDIGSTNVQPHKAELDVFRKVQTITAWAMITCSSLFAIIGVLAVWQVFGDNSDIVWRSMSSLAIVAFASLIINVSVRIVDEKRH